MKQQAQSEIFIYNLKYNSDYILSECEKHRKTGIKFAKRSGICGKKRSGKVAMDRLTKGQRSDKRRMPAHLKYW